MHVFEIVSENFKASDGSGGDEKWFTFLVDGMPSLKWFKACNDPAKPETFFVERCISRLKMGRSSEAFGPHKVQVDGKIAGAVAGKKGRAEIVQPNGPPEVVLLNGKPKEVRRPFCVTVDGKKVCECHTEEDARGAAAIHAFMTRDKLGQIPAAAEKLAAENPGKECKVWACRETHGIRATVDGEEYSIGWVPPGPHSDKWAVEKFKKKA